MKILKVLSRLVACGVFFQIAQPVFAKTVISFEKASMDVQRNYFLGEMINIEVWLYGLGDPGTTDHLALGAFDLDLSFNNSVTAYKSITFGNVLDDSGYILLTADRPSENSINFSGVSILDDLSTQPNEFQLFSLSFSADRVGTSTLKFDRMLLADALANPLDVKAYSAEINVSTVPAPASLPMICIGLVIISLVRLNRARMKVTSLPEHKNTFFRHRSIDNME